MANQKRIKLGQVFVMGLAGLALVAGNASAQQQQSSGSATFTSPVGATLIPQNPAAPIPSSALSFGLTQPNPRGFIRAEPFFIYPFARVSIGQANNVNFANSGGIDSPVIQFAPRVSAVARGGGHEHSFTYQGLFSHYTKSSDDDVSDHELIARSTNQFDARTDLRGEAYFIRRSEARGAFARAAGNEPDRFNAFGIRGTGGYGALAAQGRFEVDFGFTDKTYQNNPAITRVLDVSSFDLGGRFLYRLSPRMRALVEVRNTEFNYKTGNFDSSERRLLTGISMDATAAISGTAKVGVVRKDFKDSAFADYSAAAAEVAVRWSPLTYSTVDVVLQRLPRDTTGTAGSAGVIESLVGVYWRHQWQSYLGTYVSVANANQQFRGISRTDRLPGVNIGGYFDIRTWLRLSIDYSSNERRSSDSAVNFKRDALMFSVGATL